MKLLTALALFSVAALVTAAPCTVEHHDHSNHEDNREVHSNHEDNSKNVNKEAHQTIGSVGSNNGSSGLLAGLLGGGILSSTNNNNYVKQDSRID